MSLRSWPPDADDEGLACGGLAFGRLHVADRNRQMKFLRIVGGLDLQPDVLVFNVLGLVHEVHGRELIPEGRLSHLLDVAAESCQRLRRRGHDAGLVEPDDRDEYVLRFHERFASIFGVLNPS